MMSKYLRQPHRANCDCSVCWSRRVPDSPAPSRSTHCEHCRPAVVFKVDGIWRAKPAFLCAKHKPAPRPPKYWNCVYDSGRPTPFVPVREPFQLE
ncbi:lysogeny maintenance protein PflM [Aquipseudomonas alcaligenes]|uniref:lysogeny maintenance protein PflM n=1 Tax=Aquipseudomonas alcaligenes TaxID=43263 RepID=UPI0030132ED0